MSVHREHVFILSFNRCSSLPTVLYIFISVCRINLFQFVCSGKHLHRYRLLSLEYCFSTKQVFRSHLWVIRYTHIHKAGIHKAFQWIIPLKKWGGEKNTKKLSSLKQWETIICFICGTGRFVLTVFTAHPPRDVMRINVTVFAECFVFL